MFAKSRGTMLKKLGLFAFIILLSSEIFAETKRKTSMENIGRNIGSYFEIPVTNLERAMKFYSSVFGCDFSKENIHGNEMALFPYNGKNSGITGALAKGEIYKPSTSGTLIYLSTEDIEKTLEKFLILCYNKCNNIKRNVKKGGVMYGT